MGLLQPSTPHLDFCRPATLSGPGLAVLWLLALGLLLPLIWQAQAQWQALQEQRAWLQQWQARAEWRQTAPGPANPAQQARASAASQAARQAAWGVDRAVHHPWGQLLQAIETATPAGVRWQRLEHDRARGDLQLAGRARTTEQVLACVQALADQPGLAGVQLSRLSESRGADELAFDISAQVLTGMHTGTQTGMHTGMHTDAQTGTPPPVHLSASKVAHSGAEPSPVSAAPAAAAGARSR